MSLRCWGGRNEANCEDIRYDREEKVERLHVFSRKFKRIHAHLQLPGAALRSRNYANQESALLQITAAEA